MGIFTRRSQLRVPILSASLLYQGEKLRDPVSTANGLIGFKANQWVRIISNPYREIPVFKDSDKSVSPSPDKLFVCCNDLVALVDQAFYHLTPPSTCEQVYIHKRRIFGAQWHCGGVLFEAEDGIFLLRRNFRHKFIVACLAFPQKEQMWERASEIHSTRDGVVFRVNRTITTISGSLRWSWEIPSGKEWSWDWRPFAIGFARADPSGVIVYHDRKRPQEEVLYTGLEDGDIWTTGPHSHILIRKQDGKILVGRREKIRKVPTTLPRENANLSAHIGQCIEFFPHSIGVAARSVNPSTGITTIYGVAIR